ncbi:MAG TPA: NAD(+) diphosphatase [Acinetobacter parvus]|jgi:NAD+ diphosphatase|uniref:NAD(+) diphosphatase n=1 Tax=Acinetobacter parvus TaxID=134533 RepID=UPI002CE37E69|nr:NAD(+) diphosphatase [Acinetobacter parvus]HRM14544.1 NAD(+) diphosphatase [Acinetobacter parvus]
MTQLSLAYIFQHQKLLVDENLQLPKVEKLASDLHIHHNDHVIARDLLEHESIPDGYQLIPIRELIQLWSTTEFLQASRAVQLLEWRRNHKFCSHCGHATEIHSKEYAMVCPACGYHQYPRVQPCVITIITKGDDELLLAKSARNKSNMYGLIAGFVEVGETLEEAVQREAFEEVGVKLKNICYMSSQPWPFPSNLMIAFHAEYDSGDIQLQLEEISDAQFFKFDQLPEIPFKGSIAHSMIMQVIESRKAS